MKMVILLVIVKRENKVIVGDGKVEGSGNDHRTGIHHADKTDKSGDDDHNSEKQVSNDRSRNITGGSDHGEDEEIESLLNPNEVGEMNEDLYFDENESPIVPLEFDEVSSTLRMKFNAVRVVQLRGLVSAPIIDYLHPKKGIEAHFKI